MDKVGQFVQIPKADLFAAAWFQTSKPSLGSCRTANSQLGG